MKKDLAKRCQCELFDLKKNPFYNTDTLISQNHTNRGRMSFSLFLIDFFHSATDQLKEDKKKTSSPFVFAFQRQSERSVIKYDDSSLN